MFRDKNIEARKAILQAKKMGKLTPDLHKILGISKSTFLQYIGELSVMSEQDFLAVKRRNLFATSNGQLSPERREKYEFVQSSIDEISSASNGLWGLKELHAHMKSKGRDFKSDGAVYQILRHLGYRPSYVKVGTSVLEVAK